MKKELRQKGSICIVCKTEISQTIAAKVSHMRKHVRDGSLKEEKGKDGKLIWETTGEEPKSRENRSPISWCTHYKSVKHDPRKPVKAKSDKKGIISIRCRKCNKLSKASQEFADNRFVAIVCCDNITPFPKRMIETLTNNPNTEYAE